MSDKDDGAKPLTRRERRLREMGETAQSRSGETTESAAPLVAQPDTAHDDIEIPLLDEDGNLRTRRQIRELREAALAARREQQQLSEPAVESDGSASAETDTDDSVDEDSLAPTQAFSLEDLAEAEAAPAETLEDDPEEGEQGDDSQEAIATEDEQTGEQTDSSPQADEDDEQVGAAESYSFPDIVPLEEERSVFDDPATARITEPNRDDGQNAESSDFEAMITRAVSDESGFTAGNTASLILPALPEESDAERPLGETGELYITGSFELPKSLGETGGHSRVHDAIDSDPFAENDLEGDYYPSDPDSAPISAMQAVSSRSSSESGLVTPEVKRDSKKPLILALSGAGLLIVLAGGAVWAWSAGLFG